MKRILMMTVVASFLVFQLNAQTTRQRLVDMGLDVSQKPINPIEFELSDLDGQHVKLSSLKGKVVFLNFWATWCGPCRTEMPSMQRMYDSVKSEGLEILAIDLLEDRRQVLSFAQELKLNFTILLDAQGTVGAQYSARVIPTTYLIDRRGFLFARAVGAREWDAPEMLELLRGILRDETGF